MNTASLTELANRFGCDKGTQAFERHGYADIYSKLIPRTAQLLEIGIDAGRSVQMWSEWLIGGKLIAIDNRSECITREVLSLCDARLCDQSNQEQLFNLALQLGYHSLDVIIDDGSHRPDDQLLSLVMLWPCLRVGGKYFVEDLHTSAWFPPKVRAPSRLKRFAEEACARIRFACRNKLAVIEKIK